MMTAKERNNLKLILTSGIAAAVCAGLLWLSVLNVPFLPILFGIGVSIPIFFIQFAVNLQGAVLAVGLATILLCSALPLSVALSLSAFFFPPTLLTGWLMGLKTAATTSAVQMPSLGVPSSLRQNADKSPKVLRQGVPSAANKIALVGFYPLSAAVFQMALAVAFVTIGVVFYIFSSIDSTHLFNRLTTQIIQFIQENNLYDLPRQEDDMNLILRRFLPVLFAVSLALYGFLFQLAALYCSLRLAASKSRLKRPFGFWPNDLRMPPLALGLFILLWISSYFTESPKTADIPTLTLCLNIILAVLSVSFCAAGLAVLHQVTRGAWIWLRFILYICLFSLILTPIIFFGLVIMGIFATPLPFKNQIKTPPSV